MDLNRNKAIAYSLFFLIADIVIVWYVSAFVVSSSNYIAKSIAIMSMADILVFSSAIGFSMYVLLTGNSKNWIEKLVTIAFIIFTFLGGVICSSFSLLVNNYFSGIAAILAIFACFAAGFSFFVYGYQFLVSFIKNDSENKVLKSPLLEKIASLAFAISFFIIGGLGLVNSIVFWLFGSEATILAIDNNLNAFFAFACSLIILFGSYKYFTEKDSNSNNPLWNNLLFILLGIWTSIDGYLIIIESNSSNTNMGIKFIFSGILLLIVGLNSIIRSLNNPNSETN